MLAVVERTWPGLHHPHPRVVRVAVDRDRVMVRVRVGLFRIEREPREVVVLVAGRG